MGERDDFREGFLNANANPGSIKTHFTNFVRRTLRVALSQNGYNSPEYEAAKELQILLSLLSRCEQPISALELVREFSKSMQLPEPEDRIDRSLQRVVRDAQKYALDATSDDNAAKGRASKRHWDLIQSIESFSHDWKNRGAIRGIRPID
jgi:hypothetical protein